ncbi:hypothetical protein ACF081_33335 [Streptomyces longwoodensis]|uniref:hypothetical protein n=1 Tax=Streptomyces longwoodensis TaxID=68231 RepID=UPI0036F8B190
MQTCLSSAPQAHRAGRGKAGNRSERSHAGTELWFCEHEQPPPEEPDAVRIRAYDLRSAAQEALFRVQMLTDDADLSRAAGDVLDDVTMLQKAQDRFALDESRVRTRDDIARLVSSAKQHL